jgi:thioredoxin 1
MHVENALQLTDENFEQEVLKFSGVVLIDFWAVWCGPCIQMTPRIAELATKYAGNSQVKIAQLNIDEAQKTASAFRIMSIPTFLTFANGEQVDMKVGVSPSTTLEAAIETALKKMPTPTAVA